MLSLDPAYCADGCGRLAETERPMGVTEGGDLSVELVCRQCAAGTSIVLNFKHATKEDR